MNPNNSRQPIRHQERFPKLLIKLLDSLAMVAGLSILILWLPEVNSKSTIVISLVAIGIFHLAAEFAGAYRNWRGIPFEREAVCTTIAWVVTFAMVLRLDSGQRDQHTKLCCRWNQRSWNPPGSQRQFGSGSRFEVYGILRRPSRRANFRSSRRH